MEDPKNDPTPKPFNIELKLDQPSWQPNIGRIALISLGNTVLSFCAGAFWARAIGRGNAIVRGATPPLVQDVITPVAPPSTDS